MEGDECKRFVYCFIAVQFSWKEKLEFITMKHPIADEL